jgi:phosphoglycerol geranylgeranyltransferase
MNYLTERVSEGKVHMVLIDPEKQSPEDSASLAATAEAAGSDAIMVGGSTGVNESNLDATVEGIKDSSSLPVILFPAGAHTLSRYADAIYFMSVLNSRNLDHVVGEQKRAARVVKAMGLEPIPMGYVIVEPGMRVGVVGEATPVPRASPDEAVDYALMAEYLGMRLIYLEAGSGAPEPVPTGMIRAVREEISIPLVVGGGIRTPDDASQVARAGADIVVTGTVFEESNSTDYLTRIVRGIKERT